MNYLLLPLLSGLMAISFFLTGQEILVPSVYHGIGQNDENKFYYLGITSKDTAWQNLSENNKNVALSALSFEIYESKLVFQLSDPLFYGSLEYGTLKGMEQKYRIPYYSKAVRIIEGYAEVDLLKLREFEFNDYSTESQFVLYFRVLNQYGKIVNINRKAIKYNGTSFILMPTIMEGPTISLLSDTSTIISFITDVPCFAGLQVDGREIRDSLLLTEHCFSVAGLAPETTYAYKVFIDHSELLSASFETAPPGDASSMLHWAFSSGTFAEGNGPEDLAFGVDRSLVTHVLACAVENRSEFVLFGGDLVTGYTDDPELLHLQLHQWKVSTEPYCNYLPVLTLPGGRETVFSRFNDGSQYGICVDGFPFNNHCAEVVFSEEFHLPLNGPETGVQQEGNRNEQLLKLPDYGETAYYYRYGNMALVALNSTYWNNPNYRDIYKIGGNPKGYLMPLQLNWLERTLKLLENDDKIMHVMVVLNDVPLPCEDIENVPMWYMGNNSIRPYIRGVPVGPGIIEQRDQLLDLVINKSTKVKAIIGGSSGYTRLTLGPETLLYNNRYRGKIKLTRTIVQLSAGAIPKEGRLLGSFPWKEAVNSYNNGSSMIVFNIQGQHIYMKAVNPITLEVIDELNF